MMKEQHLIDGEDSWSFGNDYGREVVIFGADNIHHLILIIRKITFQYQVKDQLMLLMKKKKEKKIENKINFSKANTKFCLGLQYNGDESQLYVNKTEIRITSAGIIFVREVYQKILQKMNRVEFL